MHINGDSQLCWTWYKGSAQDGKEHKTTKSEISDDNEQYGNRSPRFVPDVFYLTRKCEDVIVYDSTDDHRGSIIILLKVRQDSLQSRTHSTL